MADPQALSSKPPIRPGSTLPRPHCPALAPPCGAFSPLDERQRRQASRRPDRHNTGNSTVTGYRTDRHGRLALTNEVGIATPPSAMSQGVIDLAVTQDEKFLYVQNGTSGTVDGFRIGRNGSLTKVTTATGLPPFGESGMEGIAVV